VVTDTYLGVINNTLITNVIRLTASLSHRFSSVLVGLLLVKEYATYVKFHTGCEI
jgi:hypothetical protein